MLAISCKLHTDKVIMIQNRYIYIYSIFLPIHSQFGEKQKYIFDTTNVMVSLLQYHVIYVMRLYITL